jgi:hypothetical protein
MLCACTDDLDAELEEEDEDEEGLDDGDEDEEFDDAAQGELFLTVCCLCLFLEGGGTLTVHGTAQGGLCLTMAYWVRRPA